MPEQSTYSNVTGIYWDEVRTAWRAQFFYRNQHFHVGYFETLEEAHRARDRIKRIYGDSRYIPPRPK